MLHHWEREEVYKPRYIKYECWQKPIQSDQIHLFKLYILCIPFLLLSKKFSQTEVRDDADRKFLFMICCIGFNFSLW